MRGLLFVVFCVIPLLASALKGVGKDFCITSPQSANCTSYVLPNIPQRINGVCGMMSNMPGCTVNTICSQATYSADPYCIPFSIYEELCNDMNMDCDDYFSMCATGSVVQECKTPYLPTPKSSQLSQLITSMCTEMPMNDCSKCDIHAQDLNCDLLTVYSNLCYSMPSMSECSAYNSMCKYIPNWPLCNPTAPSPNGPSVLPPQMQMYFHVGFVDYILFEQWVPRTAGQYAGTFIAVIFMAIFYDALKFFRYYMETKWTREDKIEDEKENEATSLINGSVSDTDPVFKAQFKPGRDVIRALIQAFEVGWGLIVMLIAMTYNVGLFFALLVGAFIGSLIFGRFIPYQPKTKALCH